MDRRAFVTALIGMSATPLSAEARQERKMPRIGFIGVGESAPAKWQDAFHLGLRESGFSVGESVVIDYRWLGGRLHPVPEIARELIHTGVDVIVAFGTPAALSAAQTTKTIPVVMLGVRDPVEQGIVASLAHPGGNVTGIASTVTRPGELHSKGFALFKEAVPSASRIAHLTNSTFPGTQANVDELMRIASKLNARIHTFDIRAPDDIEGVFAGITQQRMNAVSIDAALFAYRKRILQEVVRVRLPSFAGISTFAEEGALMAFSADWAEMFKHAGGYAGKILRGAKPAELPVEQPTRFEFIINLKTAKALGLTIPQSLLMRADEIIR